MEAVPRRPDAPSRLTARHSSPSSTATHREARTRKQELVEKAEALASKGTAAIPDYRKLLDDWKAAGRAGKKVDDALWARFKAAGDVLYAAKAEVDAQENAEFCGNLEQKLELLDRRREAAHRDRPDGRQGQAAQIQRRGMPSARSRATR